MVQVQGGQRNILNDKDEDLISEISDTSLTVCAAPVPARIKQHNFVHSNSSPLNFKSFMDNEKKEQARARTTIRRRNLKFKRDQEVVLKLVIQDMIDKELVMVTYGAYH